jgi:hypothetical protein
VAAPTTFRDSDTAFMTALPPDAPLGSINVRNYTDVLAQPRRRRDIPEVAAEAELVVETADGGLCGAVVAVV